MSLKQQAFQGAVWTFAEQFGSQLIGFGISVMLARLLLPVDFGTIALFGVVMSVAKIFVDGGLTGSLIRTQNADEKDLSTVFWFNLATAIILYLVIYTIAPLVSDFYSQNLLTPLIRVYAVILIIDSFVAVQGVQFVKKMDFKTNFKIQLPAMIIGGISGVGFAYYGFGAWSLVYSSLIQNSIFTLQYWFYSNWRPAFLFDREKFKIHFSYGYKLMISSLLDAVFGNIYTILIGKRFSTSELGFYNRADSLKQLPVNNISGTLSRVTFPLFVKISHDDEKLRETYKKLLGLVIFVVAPVIVLMIVTAEPLIRFLLTDKWLPAVSYFQILSLAGMLYPIHAYNLNILQVKGRSDLVLKLEILKKIQIVVVVCISIQFGIKGLVWGQVLTSCSALFINTYYTAGFLKYSMLSQLKDLMPSFFLAAACGGVAWFADVFYFNIYPDFLRLVCISMIYLLLFIGFAVVSKYKEIALLKELIIKNDTGN